MERVWNFLLSIKQSQKTHFDQSLGAKELAELGPSQEVLFRSPADDKYVPGTNVNKATEPHSYIMEAQGKCYHHTTEHIRPIHLNIPVGKAPKQPAKPKPHSPVPSHIPKPSPHLKSVHQPKKHLLQPSVHPPSCIPKPIGLPKPSKPSANASLPCVKQLLQHLSTMYSLAPIPSVALVLELPSGAQPLHSTPDMLEKIGAECPK